MSVLQPGTGRRLKVLFVVPCYFPATRYGGPIKSIHEMARGLRALDVDVQVYTTNSNGPENLAVPLEQATEVDGVPVTYFAATSPRSYFRSPRLAHALGERATEFDLIYAAWMYVDTLASAARWSMRSAVPFIVSPRGMLDRYAVKRKSALKKRAWLSLIGRRALRNAAAVHFTSEGERENSIVPISASRALVVPNGVSLTLAPAATDAATHATLQTIPPGPVAFFLGRISSIKGLDMLAKAWPDVVAEVPQARLVLAGPDDENLYGSLRRAFEASGSASSVHYVGMAGPALKAALLQRCALLVNPSYLESFGMSIVEAMSEGKPVVVTDRVNIARDIEMAGAGLVVTCDPARIARALVTLLSDPQRAASMGSAAQRLVRERYSLEHAARRMKTAMTQAVENQSHPP